MEHIPAEAIVDECQSLDDAVRQLIELGFKDPLTIARRLENLHDADWVATQLVMLSEDLIAEIARKQLGQRRRGYRARAAAWAADRAREHAAGGVLDPGRGRGAGVEGGERGHAGGSGPPRRLV